MLKGTRIGHATFETPDLERQIDYFTNVIGLVLAERDAGRAYLATRVGDLAVQLDLGEASRCSRLSFQAAPGTDFGELRRGLAAEGLRGDLRADPSPGIPEMMTFADPKGTMIDVFTTAQPFDRKGPAAGIAPLKLGHLAFCVEDRKFFPISTCACSGFPLPTGSEDGLSSPP